VIQLIKEATLIIFLRFIFFLSFIYLSGCEQPEEVQTDLYETAPVSYRTIDISVEAAGIIEPEITIEVKSKASGEILELNAETGDFVDEGTLLVQIDKRTPRNLVDQSNADLEAAIARQKIAETQLNRSKSLLDKDIITDTEFETAQLEVANSKAMVISRQVDLENARIALEDTDVKAPISGTIIEKNAERGQVISSPTKDVGGGTLLLKMADLSSVLVRTLVDETDIGKIKNMMPVTVNVAAFPNQPFNGEVLKIEPQATIEQNVTMFPVIIRLANQNGLLKPGMNAEVKINIARAENVLSIPTIALRNERDVATTASVLGISEAELRQKITLDTDKPKNDSPKSNSIMVRGREVQIPEGIDPELVKTAMAKRQNGEPPSEEERQAMRSVFQSMGGPESRRTTSNIDYQYGGEYWVLLVKGEDLLPRPIKTGITDLEYSEVTEGISEADEVLILPSSGLIERQERMQERLNQRMRPPGMGNPPR
jgi:HlyD family secretion protein